jgi:N-acetylglucosaminyldiphosphoundecaprenol N-acetyl-beta-D-mannosaminyltransferase
MSAQSSKQRIFNIDVDDISLETLLERFDHGVLVTPNVDHLITLQNNQMFYAAYKTADFVTVDSQIVFWALKILGRGVQEKISGSDFLPAFCDFHAKRLSEEKPSLSIFLLGGKAGVADMARRHINRRTSSNIVLGAHSPSMTFAENESECDSVIDIINRSGALALVVGLGAPKQELWISKYRSRLPKVKAFLAVGASIDFEARTVDRAPAWMSKLGVEWLFRLCKEPKRLWHRYLVRDPQFFWLLFLDLLRIYKDPFRKRSG